MSNIPSRIPVLRRETFVFELKGIRFSKSTIAQQPQTTHKRQKTMTTIKTTVAKEAKSKGRIRSSISTTAQQQPQATHEGEIIKSQVLVRRIEAPEGQMRALKRETTTLEPQKKSLEEDLSARWQTINLVIHAFAPFAWMNISDLHKEELKENGMNSFLDFNYVDLGYGVSGPAKDVARRIYNTIDMDLTFLSENMLIAKWDVGIDRNPLAHPAISDTEVREFLKELGDGLPDRSPLEIAAFRRQIVMSHSIS